jgi:hypothetical protein
VDTFASDDVPLAWASRDAFLGWLRGREERARLDGERRERERKPQPDPVYVESAKKLLDSLVDHLAVEMREMGL